MLEPLLVDFSFFEEVRSLFEWFIHLFLNYLERLYGDENTPIHDKNVTSPKN